jgi:hypothetical protein
MEAAMATSISIEEAVQACRLVGNGMVPGKAPVQSPLKRETSLVGLAYLNYIYQNDIANQHFCEAMLLMHAQVPPSTMPSPAPTRRRPRSKPRSPPCARSSGEALTLGNRRRLEAPS